jgi:hypothetical protein
MTSELCRHGQVVCEDCAFERGQMWAVRRLMDWAHDERDYKYSTYLGDAAVQMRDEIELLREEADSDS